MRRFAEYLIRLCESELSAGKALAQREDDQQRDHAADHDGDRRVCRQENRNHDERNDRTER